MGIYEGKALEDYRLKMESHEAEQNRPVAVWEYRSTNRKGTSRKILPESPLWETERKLLSTSPKMYDFVLGEQRRSKR